MTDALKRLRLSPLNIAVALFSVSRFANGHSPPRFSAANGLCQQLFPAEKSRRQSLRRGFAG
jgi:hypothetical protein